MYGWRNLILRIFGAKIGKGVKIFPSAIITYPWLLEIGDGTVISWGVKIYNLGKISIGKRTVISQYAHLCGGTHDIQNDDFKLLRTGLSIGDGVWVAADAFIGPGVIVGSNSIIAARSVVVKNVEDNLVVGGNPAKKIKAKNL
jgi:putative colanic acid biosynthesis acetyltransferase WcaF